MSAPLRLTVQLTLGELLDVMGARPVVMQASSAHAVVFEVEVALRDAPQGPQEPPHAPASVPAVPAPSTQPPAAAKAPPREDWRKYDPTPEEVAADRLRAHEAAIERDRAALGFSPGEPS